MKRKRERKENTKAQTVVSKATTIQEESDSDEGLFKYPGTISREQSLKMIQQLEEEISESSSSEEDAKEVIAKRLKTSNKNKKKILTRTLTKKTIE